MIPSVYIIGGAGTGKSSFMGELLNRLDVTMGPLQDLYALPNKKNIVTLRGHWLTGRQDGLYLGCMRDNFPGTDGLDRASSPVGEAWLQDPEVELPDFILGEGSTLATRRFLTALNKHTDMLLVHLKTEDFIKELRFHARGSNQNPQFVTATATRSKNLFDDITKQGGTFIQIDTSDVFRWNLAMEECLKHLVVRKLSSADQ